MLQLQAAGDPAPIFLIISMIIIGVTLLACLFFSCFVRVVPHKHTMIIERLGKFRCQCKPGIYVIVPFVDRIRKIDWCYSEAFRSYGGSIESRQMHKNTEIVDIREKVLDFGQQPVITKDLASVNIDAVLYYRITDPRLAVLRITNLPYQLELLTQATLRDIMADLTLDDSLCSRDLINQRLMEHLQNDCLRFGVTITRIELQNLLMNDIMTDAMTKQLTAERKRRSIVLMADGKRQSSVLSSVSDATVGIINAEAQKQILVMNSSTDAKIKNMLAQADADSLGSVKEALSGCGSKLRAVDYMLKMRYLGEMISQAKFQEIQILEEEAMDIFKK
ncbi:Band_7/Mec-2 family protein [Hexamita inflata]|uniref:Band 7/Mec-2 family protein n=1 Tax=Hexamita inflata TaxID=28002 RepID=A0AA86QGJ3_9EUKA|nr:Band 7/Mec-2 family protein [Hexamita inflata]